MNANDDLLFLDVAQGLSQRDREGVTVRVPLSPAMESLNVAAAGAILMHMLRPAKTVEL